MKLAFRTTGELLKALCLILLAACVTFANAETHCDPEVSRLISAQGHVDAYLAQASQWSSAQQGQPYCGDDKVRTGALSRAVLSMEKGIATFLALDQLTLLNFVKNAGRVMLSIETGQVHIRSHTPSRFDVTTPFVNAGIEGTEFLVKADEHSAEISVFEGKVRVFNDQGEIMITKGQTAQTLAGKAPILKQIDLKPDDAVRWALYSPPIIDFTTLNSLSNDPQIKLAQTRYESGDVLGAIDQLSLLINRQPSAELMAAQAGLFLILGRVNSAEYLIHEAEKTQPEHATLKALLAIIALTKNDKDLARQLAQSAVQTNPLSAIPYVALSYVEQAQFNLDLALDSIEKALQLAPQSGLIYCRKAELLASLGEISPAQAAAEKALALNPRLGRSNTILGFTQLMNANIDAAKISFRTALKLDASDPLAHLGQALADIRKGHLEPGTAQLEIAASLDPNDSLIRSYLGKAYYDQNRLSIAQLQFELAKIDDPKDPTPHFYEAISKQTNNQPTEALEAMNESIRLNDNRAVYRSRLLLDQDLAARSASLARIYNDLNFEKQAYNEASKSVLLDPTNFSAHRFLADSYAGQPRHQIARVSEVLQMQLWQPANIAIIQPQLNDASFSLPQVGGNQYSTFREFNPLFARDGANFQTSGLVASNQTYADDAVLNYRNGKFGVSAGQFHYQSDGYRENNDQQQDIYDVLAQYNFSVNTSLQAEYRHSESENGDITTT
jgi:Tfp pilus assembly protein PilF